MLVDLARISPFENEDFEDVDFDDEDEAESNKTCHKASIKLLSRVLQQHSETIEPVFTKEINMVLSLGDTTNYARVLYMIGIAEWVYSTRSDLLSTWFSFVVEKMEHNVRFSLLYVNSSCRMKQLK